MNSWSLRCWRAFILPVLAPLVDLFCRSFLFNVFVHVWWLLGVSTKMPSYKHLDYIISTEYMSGDSVEILAKKAVYQEL